MGVLCAFYFRRPRSRVNSLWKTFFFPFSNFGVFILVLSFKNTCWFVCSWLYCIAFGRTCGMFPSLTKTHGMAAAGPDRLNGWQGSRKCQAPDFFTKSQPKFVAATARVHIHTSSLINGRLCLKSSWYRSACSCGCKKNAIKLHVQIFMRTNTWIFETCQRQHN